MANAKYYILQQINATGNGHSTTVAIVQEPRIEGVGIHATKVGEVDWERSSFSNFIFKRVDPVDFIIIGNASCEERKNPFGEE